MVKSINWAHRFDGRTWKLYCRKIFLWKAPFLKKFFEGHCCQCREQKSEDRKKITLGPILKNVFWKVWFYLSTGHTGLGKTISFFWENQFFWKTFFMNNFFERHSYQWGHRGPMIEKKLNLGEKTFFPDVCSLKKTLIVLVWFINGLHRIDVINKIRILEKMFFQEKVFLQKLFWMT